MEFLDFTGNPLGLNLAIFAALIALIWFVGTRLSLFADVISDRTNLGKAFMGLLFLSLATQMSDVGTTVSAALANRPQLAINAIFGSVMFQMVLLAIVDFALIKGALTFFTPKPILMLQGVLLIVLLASAVASIALGEVVVFANVGLWTLMLFIGYIITLFLSQHYEGNEKWQAENHPSTEEMEAVVLSPQDPEDQKHLHQWSTRRLALTFAGFAGVILVAGFTISRIADALAEQTGLGTSFVGATLLAASTSLPELSVAITAVRLKKYEMAFANIFGSNGIIMVLLFIGDIFYREGPLLNEADNSIIYMAAATIVMTAVYLTGMIERKDRTILRFGIDSALVFAIYIASLGVLYVMR